MSKLKKHQFSKLYEMSSGISSKPEQAGHGAPFASFSTIFNNYFLPELLPDKMDTSVKEQEIYSIKEGDIFLTRTSETIDELGMSCVAINDYPNATFSGFVKRLRPLQTDVTYAKYMGFYLRSKFFRKTMTNNAIMTLRASLNEDIFSYLNLYLPEYDLQKTAGDLLFLLNSKIELNKQIINRLQVTANLIFDYWFVQFDFPNEEGKAYKSNGGKTIFSKELNRNIPVDWEISKMKANIKIGSGYPFDSNSYLATGKYKIITIKNVQELRIDTNKVDYIDVLPINLPEFCKLDVGDILMSLTGNVGRICIVPEHNLLLNQRVGKILCDKTYKNFAYLFFQRKEERNRLEQISTGSSQKNLSPVDAVDSYMFFPPEPILNEFNKLIDPIISKTIFSLQENQKLIRLRDWLLPMLMSGQVEVPKL